MILKTGGDKFSQRLYELAVLIQRLETHPKAGQVTCLDLHRRDREEAEGMSPFAVQTVQAKPRCPKFSSRTSVQNQRGNPWQMVVCLSKLSV